MQFGQAFSFVFEDPDWIKKIGIGALILLIPIVGQIVAVGWMLEIAKRVLNGDPQPLPDWSNFSDLLIRGLKAWVVSLVYSIPVFVLYLPFIVVTSFLGVTGGNNQSDQTMSTIIIIVSSCFGLLAFVYAILVAIVSPASFGRLAATESIGEALKFGEVFGMIRRSFTSYLMILVGMLCVGFIAPLGSILCVIGALLTAIYGQAIMGHLIGQAYVQATTTPTA